MSTRSIANVFWDDHCLSWDVNIEMSGAQPMLIMTGPLLSSCLSMSKVGAEAGHFWQLS